MTTSIHHSTTTSIMTLTNMDNNNIEQLKDNIREYIKQNGNKEITGQILQEVLLGMVDEYPDIAPVVQELLNKVDKVEGKGLSTEDFTSELLQKLNSLKKVEANPTGEATETLGTLKIGETIYTALQGPQGATGPQGPQGEQGQQGEPGLNGQDGSDGKSAYDLYVDGGGTLTQEQWIASLKANIGAFQFITPTDTTAEAALATIGSTYANAIGGVSPSQTTLNIILLMNDSNNTKTMMIATQDDGNSGFEFVYAGDLQNAMSSNVVTTDKIDNNFAGGSGKVAGAIEVKIISDTTMDIVECPNILNPQDIVAGKYIKNDNGIEKNVTAGITCYGHTPLIKIPDEGLIVYNGKVSAGECWAINIFGNGGLGDFKTAITGSVVDKTGYSDWKYVIFNLAELPAETNPEDYYAVYKGTTLPGSFIPYTPTTYKMKTPSVSFESGEKLEETIITNDFVDENDENKIADARQINNLLDFTLVKGKNLLYGEWLAKAYSSDGTLTDNGANYKHMIVPCEASTSYFLSVSGGNIGGSLSYVVLLDENGDYSSTVGNTNINSLLIETTAATHFIGVSANTGSANLQLEKGTSRTLYEAPFTPYRVPTVKTSLLPNDIIGDGAVTTPKIADKAVTIAKINETEKEFLSDNICNPNECSFVGYYINRTNGNAIHDTNVSTGCSGFIPIDEKGVAFTDVYCGGSAIGGAVYYLDAQGNKVYKRSAGETGIVTYDGGDSSLSEDNPLHYPDAYVRFTFKNTVTASNAMVNKGTTKLAYVAYAGYKEVIAKNILPSNENIVNEVLDEKKIFTNALDLLLPKRFYFVKGDTLQLFYKGIVRAIGLENRYVKPTCSVGRQYRRYLEIPYNITDAVGEKPITFKVYDDNENILGSGSSIIKVLNSPTSPSTEKHILCIGASTTEGGQWVCEAQRRLLASDGAPQGNALSNLVFVGNMEKTLWQQTAHYYGKSGWAWKDFATQGRPSFRFRLHGTGNTVVQGNQYTNNGHIYTVIEPLNTIDGVETIRCSTSSFSNVPSTSGTLTPVSGAAYSALTFDSASQDSANLFWNASLNRLDFTSYVNQYCEGSIDIVYTMLGVNNMFEDGVVQQEQYVRTFIEQLHSEYPNCVIVLATGALPSMVDMMPGYGALGDTYSNIYKFVCEMHKVYSMYKRLAEEYSSRSTDPIQVEFESWCAQVDSDYNFPLTFKDVNTRNSSMQEPYARNTIHPGDGYDAQYIRGYMQLADAAYRSIVAHLCQ